MIDITLKNISTKYYKSICYLYHNSDLITRDNIFNKLINHNILIAAKCISTCEANAIHDNIIKSKVKKLFKSNNADDIILAINVSIQLNSIDAVVSTFSSGSKQIRWLIIREINILINELDFDSVKSLCYHSITNGWLAKLIIRHMHHNDSIINLVGLRCLTHVAANMFTRNKRICIDFCTAAKLPWNGLSETIIEYAISLLMKSLMHDDTYNVLKLCNNLKLPIVKLPVSLDNRLIKALEAQQINILFINELEFYAEFYNKYNLLNLLAETDGYKKIIQTQFEIEQAQAERDRIRIELENIKAERERNQFEIEKRKAEEQANKEKIKLEKMQAQIERERIRRGHEQSQAERGRASNKIEIKAERKVQVVKKLLEEVKMMLSHMDNRYSAVILKKYSHEYDRLNALINSSDVIDIRHLHIMVQKLFNSIRGIYSRLTFIESNFE